MAIETNGLKNYLSTLPQQSDVDCIIAMDANGNPIRIKKSDLAQVAAELIGTADANKNGLMSNEYYKKCIMRSFSVLTFIKLINMTGVWQRCFLNVNGMCHSQLVSFSVRIYTDGTVKNNYKFNITEAYSNVVKMYEKDNCVYLYFPSENQPFCGIIQCSNNYTFINGQPDDTYTEIPIE